MPRDNSHSNREGRKTRALKRKEVSDSLTPEQKLARVEGRPGDAQKEKDKLGRIVVQQKPKKTQQK